MLLKLQYDSIEFERYEALRQKFLHPNFNPKEITELTLTKTGSINLPPIRSLNFLPNLRILNLSQNRINRFDPKILTKGAPKLIELYLVDNLIDSLDDLVDLGAMENLKVLSFSKNPVNFLLDYFILWCIHYKKINSYNIF
jgi:Leucine-rich repeat (LRR) protein